MWTVSQFHSAPVRWPFGAVIVHDGKIIAEGHNQVTATKHPTALAERSIPTLNLLPEEGRAAFEAWARKPDKVLY